MLVVFVGWTFICHKNVQCLCINNTEMLVVFVGQAFICHKNVQCKQGLKQFLAIYRMAGKFYGNKI